MDIFDNVQKSLRVWSLDGGGRGVLAQLIVVDKMMRLIQQKQQLDDIPRPCNYADVMIGTGLGGAAALMMGQLRLSASETYEEIVQLGQNVFGMALQKPTKSKPYFSLEILRSSISSILERHGYKPDEMMVENTLATKRCHVIVLASSMDNVTEYLCLRTCATSTNIKCTIVDAMAATMAAPDWFEAVAVKTEFKNQTLVGGCLGYNNPTWEGLLEAKEIFGVDALVTSVISIGSGKANYTAPTTSNNSEPKADDTSKWPKQMIVDCEQTAHRLSGYFRNVQAYVRFSFEGTAEDIDIINWSDTANIALNERIASYTNRVEVERDFERAITNLLQEVGSLTLGQINQAAATRIGARSIPRLTPYYVPRPDVYRFMEQNLTRDDIESQKMLIIHGMAGSGKTQSASFFERKNRKKYQHVFFIDANSVTSIKADLQSAIRSLGGSHSQDTYKDALQYLKGTESGHWLVIIDNADDPNLSLIEFIPSCDHGHIIVTTRNPNLALLAPSCHLGMPRMDDKEALAVLFMAAQSPRSESQPNDEDALEICRLVGRLPLALVQVGCYCFSSQVSFAHYLERFKEHRQRLMGLRSSWRLDEYPHSAYTSISLSYSLLDDDVKFLLHLLAFFQPSCIHVDILRASAKHHFDVDPDAQLLPRSDQHEHWLNILRNMLLTNGEWNQTRMNELFTRLQSLSLISLARDDDYTIATIDPLVQSFAQDILTADEFNRFLYMATRTLSGCISNGNETLFRHLPSHIHEVESHKADPHLNDATAFAYLFMRMASYAEALKRWRKVRFDCDEQLGRDHRSTLTAAKNVAVYLGELGDHEAAVAEIRSTIAVQERNMGRDQDDTVDCYAVLAILLLGSGKVKEAESIFQTNLQINRKIHGEGHQLTLSTTSWLGLSLYEQGRLDEAETLFNELIPTTMQLFGEDNVTTSTAAARLSRVLMKLGRWPEAEARLQRLLPWRVKAYGTDHTYTAVVLRDLALCSLHRGDLKETERLQRFVSEFMVKNRGADHKETIEAQNALEETLKLISLTHNDIDDHNANGTGLWHRNKVKLWILFVLVAFAAVLIPVIQSLPSSAKHG